MKTIIKEKYNIIEYKPYYNIRTSFKFMNKNLEFKHFDKEKVLMDLKHFIDKQDLRNPYKRIIGCDVEIIKDIWHKNYEFKIIKTIEDQSSYMNKGDSIMINNKPWKISDIIIDLDKNTRYVIVDTGAKIINKKSDFSTNKLITEFESEIGTLLNKVQ